MESSKDNPSMESVVVKDNPSELTVESRQCIVSRYVTDEIAPSKVEAVLRTYLVSKDQDILSDPVVDFEVKLFEQLLNRFSAQPVCKPSERPLNGVPALPVHKPDGSLGARLLNGVSAVPVHKPDGSPGERLFNEVPDLPVYEPAGSLGDLVVLEPDITMGKEDVEIPLLTVKWSAKRKFYPRPRAFRYIKVNVVAGAALSDLPVAVRDPKVVCCSDCSDVCMSHLGCCCAQGSTGQTCPYQGQALSSWFLNKALQCLKKNGKACSRPRITECNLSCMCPKSCGNRVMQNGLQIPFEVVFDRVHYVRNINLVAKGTFLFELCGEILTQGEARERVDFGADLEKMVNLGCANGEIFILDFGEYGNLGRFLLKGSKEEANVIAVEVFVEPAAYSYHHVAIFSAVCLPPRTTLVVYLPSVVYKDLLLPKPSSGKLLVHKRNDVTVEMLKSDGKAPKEKNTKVSPSKYIADEALVVNPRRIRTGDRKAKSKQEDSPPKPYKRDSSKRGRGGR